MPNVAKITSVGSQFSNHEEIVKVIYDFATDGGGTGSYTLATVAQECLVTGFHAVVKTACTSGGSATVACGTSADDDLFLTATAVASLTANATFGENGAFNQVIRMTAGQELTMAIATAALTAGKIEVTYKIQRA